MSNSLLDHENDVIKIKCKPDYITIRIQRPFEELIDDFRVWCSLEDRSDTNAYDSKRQFTFVLETNKFKTVEHIKQFNSRTSMAISNSYGLISQYKSITNRAFYELGQHTNIEEVFWDGTEGIGTVVALTNDLVAIQLPKTGYKRRFFVISTSKIIHRYVTPLQPGQTILYSSNGGFQDILRIKTQHLHQEFSDHHKIPVSTNVEYQKYLFIHRLKSLLNFN